MPRLLTHPSRLIRVCSSFTLVLVCYWAYSLAAVPLIEPEADVRQTAGGTSGRAPLAQRRQSDIDILFAPDDWERRDPIMLQNARGDKLLIGDYKVDPRDGSVAISPCTMVVLPEGDFASEEDRIRQAVVLQALHRAVLRFDEPVDLRSGRIGKLVSGKLEGAIVIRSDYKQPGPQDDLRIETRDVELTEEAITTDHTVKFRWGGNYGSGRQMRIDLVPAAESKDSAAPQIAGLKAFTLFRHVRFHVTPDEKQIQSVLRRDGDAQGGSVAGLKRWQPQPVEVTCQGPFRFDMQQQLATFQDRVDVLQVQPEGPSDQISGELLAIYFAPKSSPEAAPPADPNKPAANPRLQPQRLEMKGNPVIVRSPANAVHARGQRLEYELATRRLSLAGEPEVVVTRAGDEIRARELHYQPGESGRLGRFLAIGPGWLRGEMPQQSQPIEARWDRQLWIRPDPDSPHNEVVSLEGDAEARVPGMGGLQAEEIFLWLIQRPAAAPTPAGETKMELAPDRLLARGRVKIDSAQLTGGTDQLETWFEHPPIPAAPPAGPPAAAAPVVAANYTPQPAAPAPQQQPGGLSALARSRGPADQRFEVGGKLIRLKLRMTGREAELAELVIDGQARFAEVPIRERPQPQPPLLVEGNLLHVVQIDPQQATVKVSGQPAHVEAGGLGLRGAAINLDRGANRLWIDGAGLMTVQVDRDLQGRPLAQPQPLEVAWQGRMHFNGLTAAFEQAVAARTQEQYLRTQVLEITLSRRVDFAQPKQAGRPELAEVVCRGGVVLDSRTYDERGLATIEHIETADLSINRITGAILANAPPDRSAIMTQVRRGDNQAGLAIPGTAPPKANEDGSSLSFLHVQFRRQLTGDINRREITFGNNVKAVYGPVPAWDSVLTPEAMGERGMLLTCDRMLVREMPGGGPDERSTEIEAVGNASVEDSKATLRATADMIRYSSEKGKLTLEGDGRRNVTFTQRVAGGGERNVAARIVEYWPGSQRLRLDQVASGSAIEPPR